MNWLREDELVERLRELAKVEPREEFIQQLERRLAREAKRLGGKRRFSRSVFLHAGKAAAVLLFGGFIASVLASPTWQQEVVSNPPREEPRSVLAETELFPFKPTVSPDSDVPDGQEMEQHQRRTNPTAAPVTIERAEPKPPSTQSMVAVQPKTDDPHASRFKEIASRHLQNILGEGTADFQVNEAMSSYRNEFGQVVFTRMVNGIPYLGESYQIGVTGEGKVSGVTMHTNRDFSLPVEKFPAPVGVMTQEEAEESFARHMRLVYAERQPVKLSSFSGKPLETRPVLQYRPPVSGYLDAKTGNPVAIDAATDQPFSLVPVAPEGRPLVARSAKEVSQLLAEEFQVSLPAEEIERVEIAEDETWWLWNGGKLTVSSASGRVTGLVLDRVSKTSRTQFHSLKEAEQLAVDFLQTYLDPKVSQLMVAERIAGEAGRPHRFHFQLCHEGIPVIDRSFKVDVDPYSGQIVAFSGDFQLGDEVLPDKQNIVPAERAAAEYLQRYPLQLAYIWPNEAGRKAESPILVYTPLADPPDLVYVDAVTGEFVDITKSLGQ